MSRRSVFLAVIGAMALAGAVAAATALTLRGGTDPVCPDDAYGCAEFFPNEPLLIGVLGREPETRRGVELAISTRRPLRGRAIEVVAEDDECSLKGAARAARELASDPPVEPPVVAVIDAGCAVGLQAAAQILSNSGITLVTTQSVPVEFDDPPRSFLVRAPVGEPDRTFGRRYEARYGRKPTGIHAWIGYRTTQRVLTQTERLAVEDDDGRLLVPRSALHRALSTS